MLSKPNMQTESFKHDLLLAGSALWCLPSKFVFLFGERMCIKLSESIHFYLGFPCFPLLFCFSSRWHVIPQSFFSLKIDWFLLALWSMTAFPLLWIKLTNGSSTCLTRISFLWGKISTCTVTLLMLHQSCRLAALFPTLFPLPFDIRNLSFCLLHYGFFLCHCWMSVQNDNSERKPSLFDSEELTPKTDIYHWGIRKLFYLFIYKFYLTQAAGNIWMCCQAGQLSNTKLLKTHFGHRISLSVFFIVSQCFWMHRLPLKHYPPPK